MVTQEAYLSGTTLVLLSQRGDDGFLGCQRSEVAEGVKQGNSRGVWIQDWKEREKQ